jgi:serine/threonine protein kinase
MASDKGQMSPERWSQIKQVFHAALEREAANRAAFLDEACRGDDEMRGEVDSLLDAHEQPDSLIDKPAFEAAADFLPTREFTAEIGRAIGPYKIVQQIGRGGMGEVYLAQDTRLGRRVALKLLPFRFTSDEDRLRRFKQEARAASSLNHPNIITIHEVGQADDAHFIATEFVEGKTLRSSIARGPMKLDETLEIVIQVASALRAAHEAGIVHRDIKPENIMLRPDGYVKVVDFGLAKLSERRPMTDDTGASFSAIDTNPGIVMGTVSYMSPEQARGLAVDARGDIFSLGVVLYEMIAGRPPFEGATISDLIVAILEKEPPALASFTAEAPAELESVIDRALRKSQDDRYQTAKEMLDDLRKLKQIVEIQARIDSSSTEEFLAVVGARRSAEQALSRSIAAVTGSNVAHSTGKIKLHKKVAIIVSAALVVALAVVFWIYKSTGQSKLATPFQPMEIVRVNTVRKALDAAISPDGKYVAYVTSDADRQTVWLKQLATNTDTQIIPPAEMNYRWLTFSPNGNYLCYVANRGNEPRVLYQMATTGGPARKLAVRVRTPFSFSPDGKRLAFVRHSSEGETALIVADVEGSGEQKLILRKLPDWFSDRGVAWSPDGKVIVCSAGSTSDGFNITTVEVRVEDGTVRPITSWPGIQRASWLRNGSGLVAVALDRYAWEFPQLWFISYPGGEARRITTDLSKYSPFHLSMTADSSAILALKSDTVCNIWVAPDASASRAKQITFGAPESGDGLYGLSWTPDGELVYGSYVGYYQAVFIMNADGTDSRQLTAGDYSDSLLTTTLDGRYIVFQSTRALRFNIWRIDIDGNNLKQLTDSVHDIEPDCSPDGKWVFYVSYYEGKKMLYRVPIDGGEPVRLFDKECEFPAVSPDGKLIALPYVDEQANARRVGVISSETGQLLKSFDLGSYWNIVHWTPDGRGVAYIKTESDVSNIWAQPLEGGKPAPLTDFKSDRIFNFAWSNDGKQLAIARGSETSDVVLIRDIR